jgi:hypothetical protein
VHYQGKICILADEVRSVESVVMIRSERCSENVHDLLLCKRYPSSRNMALGSTQLLTEMSTRNLPAGKGWPAREADLTAICELIV